MLDDILLAFWFMLPATVANGAPILAARLPLLRNWNTPMDFNRSFHGHPLLGSHKTWRGLVSGIVMATVMLWVEQQLASHFTWSEAFTGKIDYQALPTLLLGPLLGLGALGGDAIKSFFKRRRNIPAGIPWPPYDELDYIIGAIIASLAFVVLTVRQYVIIFVMWFTFHVFANFILWKLGLQKTPL